jgi:hypothetical protein
MMEKVVELIRRFEPMSSRSGEWDFLMAGSGRSQRWHEIEDAHRVLIIADPGAGKTFEATGIPCAKAGSGAVIASAAERAKIVFFIG